MKNEKALKRKAAPPYTPESVRALESLERRFLTAAVLTASLGLAVCAALCFGVRTRNADFRRTLVICLSALSAWTAVELTVQGTLPARREAAHENGVMREEETAAAGKVVRLEKDFRIPKSIAFTAVTLEGPEGEIPLKLNARFRKGFPPPGRTVRVRVRRGYIMAWEEEAE